MVIYKAQRFELDGPFFIEYITAKFVYVVCIVC